MDQGGEWYRIENDLHSRQKKSGGKALEAYHRCWRAWRHYRWWDVQRHVCTITRSRCTSMCQEKGKFVWSLCEVCMSFVWSLHEVCVKYIWLLACVPMRVSYIVLHVNKQAKSMHSCHSHHPHHRKQTTFIYKCDRLDYVHVWYLGHDGCRARSKLQGLLLFILW